MAFNNAQSRRGIKCLLYYVAGKQKCRADENRKKQRGNRHRKKRRLLKRKKRAKAAQKKEDGTKGTKDSKGTKEDKETSAEASEKDGSVATETADENLFTAYRMELEDARSKEREQLNSIVSSDDATAKEKSEAYDKMTALSNAEGTEKQLETLIKTQGYKDALVDAEGDKINITVMSDKHSNAKASAIIDLVEKEIKNMKDVAVTFEPTK